MCMVLHVRAPDQPAVTKARIRVDPRSRSGQGRAGKEGNESRVGSRQGLESVGRLMGRGGGVGTEYATQEQQTIWEIPFLSRDGKSLTWLGVRASCRSSALPVVS